MNFKRQAFQDWLGPNNGRDSWDPITVVAAVRGAAGVHCKEVGAGGHMTLVDSGYETWHDGGNTNQSKQAYVVAPHGRERERGVRGVTVLFFSF